MIYSFHADGTDDPSKIFVFGSNLAGRHGAGAAHHAMLNRGAEYGVGVGLTGDSFAIPTKDQHIDTMDLEEIRPYVKGFLKFAARFDELQFFVTRIGCGLAGYKDEDIAPMFVGAPENCDFPEEWKEYLGV